jgi:hypothetical protein
MVVSLILLTLIHKLFTGSELKSRLTWGKVPLEILSKQYGFQVLNAVRNLNDETRKSN